LILDITKRRQKMSPKNTEAPRPFFGTLKDVAKRIAEKY
jgi:hypothetical protein